MPITWKNVNAPSDHAALLTASRGLAQMGQSASNLANQYAEYEEEQNKDATDMNVALFKQRLQNASPDELPQLEKDLKRNAALFGGQADELTGLAGNELDRRQKQKFLDMETELLNADTKSRHVIANNPGLVDELNQVALNGTPEEYDAVKNKAREMGVGNDFIKSIDTARVAAQTERAQTSVSAYYADLADKVNRGEISTGEAEALYMQKKKEDPSFRKIALSDPTKYGDEAFYSTMERAKENLNNFGSIGAPIVETAMSNVDSITKQLEADIEAERKLLRQDNKYALNPASQRSFYETLQTDGATFGAGVNALAKDEGLNEDEKTILQENINEITNEVWEGNVPEEVKLALLANVSSSDFGWIFDTMDPQAKSRLRSMANQFKANQDSEMLAYRNAVQGEKDLDNKLIALRNNSQNYKTQITQEAQRARQAVISGQARAEEAYGTFGSRYTPESVQRAITAIDIESPDTQAARETTDTSTNNSGISPLLPEIPQVDTTSLEDGVRSAARGEETTTTSTQTNEGPAPIEESIVRNDILALKPKAREALYSSDIVKKVSQAGGIENYVDSNLDKLMNTPDLAMEFIRANPDFSREDFLSVRKNNDSISREKKRLLKQAYRDFILSKS